MALYPIRIGQVRRVTVRWIMSVQEPCEVHIVIMREDGRELLWTSREKAIVILATLIPLKQCPWEVMRTIETNVSLGRRAYLRSLLGPDYRARYP